jgi:hypothetical protein
MRGAKYLTLGALVATPAVLVLAVQRGGPTRAGAATISDAGRSQWEYRVLHERELLNANDGSTALASYTESIGAAEPRQAEAKLNEMGTQGWALVAVEDHQLIFRRGRN